MLWLLRPGTISANMDPSRSTQAPGGYTEVERVQGNILMVLHEDAGSKAWDEPRGRHYPYAGQSPAEVCPGNDTNHTNYPTHHFSSLTLPILSTL